MYMLESPLPSLTTDTGMLAEEESCRQASAIQGVSGSLVSETLPLVGKYIFIGLICHLR